MRGMILAAGRGARMGDLTLTTPKPLLKVKNRYLIEYSLQALIDAGIRDIIINVSYLGEQIKQVLGNGQRYGVNIYYSEETQALETGGGIYQALSLLGKNPFIVLSSDVITDYPLQNLPKEPQGLAHLVLVDNPDYHPQGDFYFNGKTFTFANIGIYRPELFIDCQPGCFRLGSLLHEAYAKHQVTMEHYSGFWHNLGTPQQLSALLSS